MSSAEQSPNPAREPSGAVTDPELERRGHGGWILSLFLMGVAGKFWLIQHLASPLPYWDQWEAEALDVYVPFFKHQLALADLFRAHNEHHIFLTRVYDLALLVLNGQWDSQLQMVLNAVLHSAALAGFGWLMARWLGRAKWPLIWLPLVLALVLPFGLENTLWGFQSSFYFLLILSVLTIWLLAFGEPWSARWLLGAAAAAGTLVTVASGFLAAVTVAALALPELLKQPRNWRRHLPTLVVCALVVLVGILIKTDVPRHQALQAHSLPEFLNALGRNLAFPHIFSAWYACFNLLPLVLLAGVHFFSPPRSITGERLILGVGLWAVLQGAATAYARGAGGSPPAGRYMDSASFLMIVNCLSLVVLWTRCRSRRVTAVVCLSGAAVWVVFCLTGLWSLDKLAFRYGENVWSVNQKMQLQNTRAFITTDDPRAFPDGSPLHIPAPDVNMLVALLRNPDIRRVLPASAREPLKLGTSDAANGVFVLNGCRLAEPDPPAEVSRGSFSDQGARGRGNFEGLAARKSALPYLEIPVAGDLGQPGLSLKLIDLGSGRSTPIQPSQIAGERWLNVYVRAPTGEFKVVATDDSETGWFAFKEPREVGRLSFWAIQTLTAWRFFLAAGLVCCVWNAGWWAVRRSRFKQSSLPQEVDSSARPETQPESLR